MEKLDNRIIFQREQLCLARREELGSLHMNSELSQPAHAWRQRSAPAQDTVLLKLFGSSPGTDGCRRGPLPRVSYWYPWLLYS